MGFGVYVLTYPGDYYLAIPLIASLETFNPGIDIHIIPGDGFNREDHPFGKRRIMREPKGFYREMRHMDKKFWCYAGDFDSFLYLDADMLCLRSINGLSHELEKDRSPAIHAKLPSELEKSGGKPFNAETRKIVYKRNASGQLAVIEMIRRFDPLFDPFGCFAVNSGIFASRRDIFSEDDFRELNEKERSFYASAIGVTFDWHKHLLFFNDQGRFNYLIWKKRISIKPLAPYDDCWGGGDYDIDLRTCLAGGSPYAFVHWAGCPRPTGTMLDTGLLFRINSVGYRPLAYGISRKSVPLLRIWKHFCDKRMKKKEKRRLLYQGIRKMPRMFVVSILRSFCKPLYAALKNLETRHVNQTR